MAVLDDDFSVDATLTEEGAGIWSPPKSTLAGTPQDFQSLYEQQRARAEAAEARCEELRWAEVAARSDAGSWKSRFRSCRRRLSEANEEAKELRRAAKAAPSLRAPELRERNLPLVVDNPRFLILPWIEIPNLGSHILALVRRRLPEDWAERYNTAPVLIETFVETPRYTGAVYRASGWLRVGTTQGRGRYDRDKLYDKPRKDVWLRPLRRDWRRTLNR